MNLFTKADPYHWSMMAASLVLAVWVLVCPWVIADAGEAIAAWNFHAAGAVAVVLSIVALMRSDDLAEYGLMAVGAWLLASPWALDLSPTVTRQSVFYGAVLCGLAWLGRPSFKPKSTAAE